MDKYLTICEQLGTEPDPERMPLDYSAFPEEVQMAFFMYSLLPDNWDGSSGSYMGKHWASCAHLFDIWKIEVPKTIMLFMKMYERLQIDHRAEIQKAETEARERQQKAATGGGRQYTHNVKG